jgi:hypothetical protein
MGSPLMVDLNALPRHENLGDGFNYVTFAQRMLAKAIPSWQHHGFIKSPGNGSWGGFVANPEYAGHYHHAPIDDPYRFIGTVFGFGPEQLGYALNAARKGILLAEMSREHGSTMAIRRVVDPGMLGESASSAVTDRDLRWMQFGYGGAVLVGEGSEQRLWGISAFLEEEDDVVARLLGVLAQTTIGRLD